MIKKFTLLVFLTGIASLLFCQEVVWGDVTGEGDFNGGLNEWTVETLLDTDSSWIWSADGNVSNGLFAGNGLAIQSPTVDNGCMSYNYDFYVTGGIAAPDPYPIFESSLISPNIDLTGATGAFSVQYSQLLRWFQAKDQATYTSFRFSTDNGANWSDPIDGNPNAPANPSGALNSTETVNIPFAITNGASSIRIKITFAGNFYFWVVDDVKLINRTDPEVSANPFFAIANNYMTPISQIANSGFLIDVANTGGTELTNVNANIEIIHAITSNSVYSDDNPYGTLAIDSVAENIPFPNLMSTELETGIYEGTYTVTSNEDTNLDNNSQTFTFEISDTIFAKENGFQEATRPSDQSPAWVNDAPHSWGYGTVFTVPNGEGWIASKVLFGMEYDGEQQIGQSIFVNLYEWNNDNNDNTAQVGERTLVGFGFHFIDGTEVIGEFQEVDMMVSLDGEPIMLKDNTTYIVMIEWTADDETNNLPIGVSSEFNYNGQFQLGIENPEIPRHHVAIYIGEDSSTQDFNMIGFGLEVMPAVRLAITDMEVGTKDQLSDSNKIEIAPNPATSVITVSLDLDKDISSGTVSVVNTNGQIIHTEKYVALAGFPLELNVSEYPAGTYFLNFKTTKGVSSKKFTVVK